MSNLLHNGQSLKGVLKNAIDIIFNNQGTTLTSTNVEDAIKEVNSNLSGQDYVEVVTSGQSYSSAIDTLFSMINRNKIQPGKSYLLFNNVDICPIVQLAPTSIIASHTYIDYNNKLTTDTFTCYANGSKFVNKTDSNIYDNSSTASTGTTLRFVY